MNFHERCPVFDTLAEQRAYERGYLDASTQYLKILADLAALRVPTIQLVGPLPEGLDLKPGPIRAVPGDADPANWGVSFAEQVQQYTDDESLEEMRRRVCADTKPPSN